MGRPPVWAGLIISFTIISIIIISSSSITIIIINIGYVVLLFV